MFIKRRVALFSILGLGSVFALGSKGLLEIPDHKASVTSHEAWSFDNPTVNHRQEIHAVWAEEYRLTSTLDEDAKVVALGVVTARSESVRVNDVPRTLFKFQVSEYLRGDPTVTETTLTVKQNGGFFGDTAEEFEGDPLFKIGDTYVLFLSPAEDGSFYVVGGPQGRLRFNDEGIATGPAGEVLVTDDLQLTSDLSAEG